MGGGSAGAAKDTDDAGGIGLGLDAGGTQTRWAAVARHGGVVLCRGSTFPLSGLVFTKDAEAAAANTVAALAAAVPRDAWPMRIAAGVTGTEDSTAAARIIQRLLAQAFCLPLGHVRVGNDLQIAYRAAFPASEEGGGVLVYGGTGSAACHVARDGTMLRVGGHGYLLDDAGSGYAIARDGLRAVLRAEDERPGSGWTTPLGRELAATLGGAEWDQVRVRVYGGNRASLAAMAPAVARAAEAGDPAALDVLRAAGRELGRLAMLLRGRLGPVPVVLAGRAAAMHPVLLEEVMDACGGGAVRLEQADAAAAAARLAAEEAVDDRRR